MARPATRSPKDYGEAVALLMSKLTRSRQAQVYEFVLFLLGRSSAEEETHEMIDADEALWDAQFAATSLSKIDELIAGVDADIATGRTKPLFDAKGEFIDS